MTDRKGDGMLAKVRDAIYFVPLLGHDDEKAYALACARAALIAMREPSDEIIAEGIRGVLAAGLSYEKDDDREANEVRMALRWMIDAMISEEEG